MQVEPHGQPEKANYQRTIISPWPRSRQTRADPCSGEDGSKAGMQNISEYPGPSLRQTERPACGDQGYQIAQDERSNKRDRKHPRPPSSDQCPLEGTELRDRSTLRPQQVTTRNASRASGTVLIHEMAGDNVTKPSERNSYLHPSANLPLWRQQKGASERVPEGGEKDQRTTIGPATAHGTLREHHKYNVTKLERDAVVGHSPLEGRCTITKSDKGGKIVVTSSSTLMKLCMEHLNDQSTYEELRKDPTNSIRVKINKTLDTILTKCDFPSCLIDQLKTSTTVRTQTFYALPKLTNDPEDPANRARMQRHLWPLWWFLQQLLKPLLTKVSAHLKSTSELIERFEKAPQADLQNMIPISFDVVSLHTNIDTKEAIETRLEYVNKYNMYLYSQSTSDVWELLHLLLDNVFKFDKSTFKQIRGLAMGNRLSGTHAIFVMDRFEGRFDYKELQPSPVVFVRYVDEARTLSLGSVPVEWSEKFWAFSLLAMATESRDLGLVYFL